MSRIKILVSAYACEPNKGSEIGVGWHWVLEMSKYFELWVLTRANNRIPIEQYFDERPEADRIHWLYYDLPVCIKRFKRQMRGVRTYYTLWQFGANRLVRQTMEENGISVFHLLTYGNAIWHISSFGQKRFFLWGPTGGTDTIPVEYSRYYSAKQRMTEAARRLIVGSLKYQPGFRKRCRRADLILCKTRSAMEMIPAQFRKKAMLFTDVAVETLTEAERGAGSYIKIDEGGEKSAALTYIAVGRLDGWRGFDLIIEAFKRIQGIRPDIRLKIVGEGAEHRRLETLIKKTGLAGKVMLTGQLSGAEYREEMKRCDAVINACLKEGGVTNAFDCMAYAKPLICIDTGGYTENFDESCAIILPRRSRSEVIKGLADGMIKLTDSDLRRQMSEAMILKGEKMTWEEKGIKIAQIITNACQSAQMGKT